MTGLNLKPTTVPASTSTRADSKAAQFAVWAGALVAAPVGIGMLVVAGLATFGWLPIAQPNLSKVGIGDLASLAVAGATLLLDDFTALLAWLTRRSIKLLNGRPRSRRPLSPLPIGKQR